MATPLHSARRRRATGRRATAVLASSAALLLSAAGLANADQISNGLSANVDATAEVMPLNVGGTDGTTSLAVTPANDDGKQGCNLTGSKTLTVAVQSSNTSVATVSPSSIMFTGCGDTPTITVHPVTVGSTTVTLQQTANTTAGTFDLAPATFTVNVTAPAPANTAPTVTVGGVTNGGSYAKGSVPTATCDVTDAEDGPSSFPATLSVVTGSDSTDGIGTQVATCSYTDHGVPAQTATSSATYTVYDPTPPTINYTLTPALPDGSNGWYRGNATLHWAVTEDQSPSSLQKTGCVDQTITADQVATTYSCSATSAGGSADQIDVTIKRDGSAPIVTHEGVSSGTTGLNGWYTSPVTEAFSAVDNGPSGLADCSASFTRSSGAAEEGGAVTIASGTCTDNAGNVGASVDSPSYKIDLTDPTNVQFVGGPANGESYYFGSVPTEPTCTADDAVSLFDHCTVSGYSAALGAHQLTATAFDHAGRSAEAESKYNVLAWTLKGFYAPVDMGGIWNTVKGGSTVPLKFELFAGSTELTNTSSVQSFTTRKIDCTSGTQDPVETLAATGGTSLRYDTTSGQFIQNWKTPTGAGCYVATMTAADGSTISANFKTK